MMEKKPSKYRIYTHISWDDAINGTHHYFNAEVYKSLGTIYVCIDNKSDLQYSHTPYGMYKLCKSIDKIAKPESIVRLYPMRVWYDDDTRIHYEIIEDKRK